METIISNLGWIFIVFFFSAIFLYKKITNNKEALTSKFSAKKILPFNLNESLGLCQKALENARFTKVVLDSKENRLQAQNGFSMKSWSEFIQVKAIAINGSTEIKFKSICAVPTQIYDWGKNKKNYKRFETELNKLTAFKKVA